MEYINLTITQLHDAAFVRSSLTDRAVWLMLLRYCVQQENRGRIPGAQAWDEWDCAQLLGVRAADIEGDHKLWRFDSGDLVIEFYPLAKQKEVQAKRKAGKDGGLSSGLSRNKKPVVSPSSSASSSASITPLRTPRTERKGKEGKENGKEMEGEGGASESASPPQAQPESIQQVEAYFVLCGSSPSEAQKFFDHFEANGWKQGGRARIKSWHAAARNWIRRSREGGFDPAKNRLLGSPPEPFDPTRPNAHTGGLEIVNLAPEVGS